MYNPETLATLDTQDTGQRQTKQGAIKNVQSRDTPETLATLDTQDTGQRQTKQGAIKNVQSRDTGNIRYTRHRTKTNKTRGHQEWTSPETLATLDTQDTGQRQTKQGAIKNVQSRDTGNIRYTRHRTKTNKTRGHQEWTIQRHWQY